MPASKPEIEGGVVDGIAVGSVYALAKADDTKGGLTGYVRVTEVGTAAAAIEPVERDGIAAPDFVKLAKSRLLVATLVESGGRLHLHRRPPGSATATDKAGANIARGARRTRKSARRQHRLRLCRARQRPADLGLFISGGRLWLSPGGDPPSTEGRDRTPSVPLSAFADPEKAAGRVKQVLTSLAKAQNLIRIADTIDDKAVRGALTIEAHLYRPDLPAPAADAKAPDDVDCPDYPKDKVRPSRGLLRRNRRQRPRRARPRPVRRRLLLDRQQGREAGRRDAALCRRRRRHCLCRPGRGAPHPSRRSAARRAGAHRHLEPEGQGAARRSASSDLLFLAVVQEGRDAVPADFRYLAQPAATKVANRGGGGSPLRDLLEGAAFGSGAKRSGSTGGIGEAGVVQFRWRVRAPGEGS